MHIGSSTAASSQLQNNVSQMYDTAASHVPASHDEAPLEHTATASDLGENLSAASQNMASMGRLLQREEQGRAHVHRVLSRSLSESAIGSIQYEKQPLSIKASSSKNAVAQKPNATVEECFSCSKKTADKLIRQVLAIMLFLREQTDLSPHNPDVNSRLSLLVDLVSKNYDESVVTTVLDDCFIQAGYKQLLDKLSCAEGEMEKFFARVLINKDALKWKDLEVFPHLKNYKDLTVAELDHWESSGDNPKAQDHIAFVGSGALPFTAIFYRLLTGATVICMDLDEEAIALSRQVIQKLGLSEVIQVQLQAGETADFTGKKFVIIAALVPRQVDVARKALQDFTQAGKLDELRVGVRSVEKMRALLYPPADIKALEAAGLEHMGGSKTSGSVINTLQTFRPSCSKSSLLTAVTSRSTQTACRSVRLSAAELTDQSH